MKLHGGSITVFEARAHQTAALLEGIDCGKYIQV